MLEALNETRQSGAFNILYQSFDNQVQHGSLSHGVHVNQVNSQKTETAMTNSIQINNRIFKETPGYLKEFMANKGKTTLVIFSEDCSITLIRLKETLDNCKIFLEFKEFADDISNKGASSSQVAIIKCDENLEQCERLTYGIKRKCVLLTRKLVFKNCATENDIIKKLNKIHMTIENDSITWGDLTASFRLQLCTQLKTDPRIDLSDNDISEALVNANYSTFVELINKKKPTLFKSLIPPPIVNYIPRSILSRNVIGTQIFTSSADDIYFFLHISIRKTTYYFKSEKCQQLDQRY